LPSAGNSKSTRHILCKAATERHPQRFQFSSLCTQIALVLGFP
jgi:hypothetical protein